jgi:predicted nucleic acid-binding protein
MQFVDTNILLYAVSTAPEEKLKSQQARRLLDREDLALSVQVLQEFYMQATRSSRPDPLTHTQASQLVEAFLRFAVQENTIVVMIAALACCNRFGISYWDAAIIEAARSLGCRTVLSEDLAHGRDYGGVVVKDPFRAG